MKYTQAAARILLTLKARDPSYLPEEQEAIEQQGRRAGQRVVTAQHLEDALTLIDGENGRERFRMAEHAIMRATRQRRMEARRREQSGRREQQPKSSAGASEQ